MVINKFQKVVVKTISKSNSRITAKHVYDSSGKSSNSHIKNLPPSVNLELGSLFLKKFAPDNIVVNKYSNVMDSSGSLNDKLDQFKRMKACNNDERAQKEIFRYM